MQSCIHFLTACRRSDVIKHLKQACQLLTKWCLPASFVKDVFQPMALLEGSYPHGCEFKRSTWTPETKYVVFANALLSYVGKNATFRIFYAESVDGSTNRRYEIMLGEYINHQIQCALSPFQVWLLEWYYSASILRILFNLMTLRKGSRPCGSELKRCACFCLVLLQEKPLPRLTSLLQQDLQESAFAQSRLPYLNGEMILLMCRQYLQ